MNSKREHWQRIFGNEAVHIVAKQGATTFVLLCWSLTLLTCLADKSWAESEIAECPDSNRPSLTIDTGHPWRPPFGLDRVGSPPVVHVAVTSKRAPTGQYSVAAFSGGKEIAQHRLSLVAEQDRTPNFLRWRPLSREVVQYFGNAKLAMVPDEVALYVQCHAQVRKEVARTRVSWPALEAQAIARQDSAINPIDLGTFLVPHGTLLMRSGQSASVEVAALSRIRDMRALRLKAAFSDAQPVEMPLSLSRNERRTSKFTLPLATDAPRTSLHVSLIEDGRELWKQEIPVMVVNEPPHWPQFGAIKTRLRYDSPIPRNDPKTGQPLSAIDYSTAWSDKLHDVVIFLPNGSRFVFWRGANYVPLWAGQHDTGVTYQWAENLSHQIRHADGTIDYREPIFDSELRYGRVEIVESSLSRVHVRWTYQLTDVEYSPVLGDSATEDFYFYPDGFGTRVVSLSSVPEDRYQLTEFMVVTAAGAYPLEIVPREAADLLFLDGHKERISFPVSPKKESSKKNGPAIVRIHPDQTDTNAVVYFDPHELHLPYTSQPLLDQGEIVTPAYWGNHWPLARGRWTGWTINNQLGSNPSHSTLISWVIDPPHFLSESRASVPDSTGVVRPMVLRRWAFLIAQSDAADNILIDWAKSYSRPPSVEVMGARLAVPSYSAERRAIRLVAQSRSISIHIKPQSVTVNPVFEIEGAARILQRVTVNDNELPAESYAWDGGVLWIKAMIRDQGARIALIFSSDGQ